MTFVFCDIQLRKQIIICDAGRNGGNGMDSRKIRDDSGLEYVVNFEWDDEAKVWIATSDDIDGLTLESDSLDRLMQRVMVAAPEIIEMNHLPLRPSVRFSLEHREKMAFA